MSLWDGLFGTKSGEQFIAPTDSSAIGRVVGDRASGLGMSGLGGSDDIGRAVEKYYERVLMVYRCVDSIATSATLPVMYTYQPGDGDGIRRPDDVERVLNDTANTYESAAAFRYRLTTQLLLSRKGAFVELIRGDASNSVVEMHLLPSPSVEPIPDSKKFVKGYRIRSGNVDKTLDPERVVWIRCKPHPTDVYAQMTPLVAAELAADTDYLARVFNRNFLRNDGRPGMIVSVKGVVSREDMLELRRRYSGGGGMAGQTTVIGGDSISLADMAASPRDVQWSEAVRGSNEDIRLAFGVPESKLGNASGRTFANADAEDEGYWRETMVGHLTPIANALDVVTTGGTTDRLRVAYDYDKIAVMQRIKELRHAKLKEDLLDGIITLDEYRTEVGMKPLDVPLSRVLWLVPGRLAVGTDEDVAVVNKAVQVGQGVPADPAVEARKGAQQGIERGIAKVGDLNAARALRLAGKSAPVIRVPAVRVDREHKSIGTGDRSSADDSESKRGVVDDDVTGEAKVGALVETCIRRYGRVVEARLAGTKLRTKTRLWSPPGDRPLDLEAVVAADASVTNAVQDIGDFLAEMRMVRRNQVLIDIGDLKVDTSSLFAPEVIIRKALDNAGLAFGNHARKMRDALREAYDNGDDLKTMQRTVRQVTNSRVRTWSPQLAAHLYAAVREGVAHETAVRSNTNEDIVKRWVARDDAKTRPTHWEVDSEEIPVNQRFVVGGFSMAHPHDPDGPIGETAGCRCTLAYRRAR